MSDVITRNDTSTTSKTKLPDMWKVILHNDDSTPMEFVMYVLITIFNKSPSDAYELMMRVHMSDKGCAGIYIKEIAETKMQMTNDLAAQQNFPLKTSIEKV